MSASASTPALKRTFRRFLRNENVGSTREQYCHWTEIPKGEKRICCKKPISKVSGALEDFLDRGELLDIEELLDLEDLNKEAGVFHVPEYIYQWALCEHHQAAYMHLCNEHRDRISQSDSVQLISHHGLPESKASCGDHSDYQCSEASDIDLHKKLQNLAACLDEEREKEEVFDKADVSQGRKKRIDIYNNDFRVLVDISTHGIEGPSSVLYDKEINRSADARSLRELAINEEITRNPLPDQNTNNVPKTPQKFVSPSPVSQNSASRKSHLQTHMGKSPGCRNTKASETLSADSSYEHDVADNERVVRDQLRAPLVIKEPFSKQQGFVYAFRDEALGLVKIGSTLRDPRVRKKEVERKCKILRSLSLVGFEKVVAYKRLERIIQQDLAPHRWFFNCECGSSTTKKGFTRHQEWFQIDNVTLLSTLGFWAGFVKSDPWTQHPEDDQKFSLQNVWRNKLSVPPNVKSDEEHDNHQMRQERWRKLLGVNEFGVIETNSSKELVLSPAYKSDDKINASVSTRSLADSTPSKPPTSSARKPAEAHNSSGMQETWVQRIKDLASSETSPKPRPRTESQSLSSANLPVHSNTFATHTFTLRPAAETPEAERESSSLLGGRVPPQIFGDSRLTSVRHNVANTQGNSAVTWTFDSTKFGQKQTPHSPKATPIFGTAKPFDHCRPSDHQVPTVFGLDGKRPRSAPDTHIISSEFESRNGKPSSSHESNVMERKHHQTTSASSDSDVSNCKHNPDEVAFSSDRLVQSLLRLVTQYLAKEARPLPARTISADLWQLRWPLACSVALALQAPHIPPALSFVIWGVFLPFFVAELRGWTGEGPTH